MKIIFCLLLISLLWGCSGKPNFTEQIESGLETVYGFDNKKYEYIVIIPGAGCSGCISEAESFYMDHKDDNIFYIFTDISSRKALKLRIGDIDKPNVFLDKECIFLSEDNNINLYPIVVDIRTEKMKWTYLNPGCSLETLFDESDT